MMNKLDRIERQPTGISTRTVYTAASANNSEATKWENNSIKEDQVKQIFIFNKFLLLLF